MTEAATGSYGERMKPDVEIRTTEEQVTSFYVRGYEEVRYNRALTDDERRRVEAYLAAKWGVTLA